MGGGNQTFLCGQVFRNLLNAVDYPFLFRQIFIFLTKIGNPHGLSDFHLSLIHRNLSQNRLHQSRLSCPVLPNNADTVISQKIIAEVRKQKLISIAFAQIFTIYGTLPQTHENGGQAQLFLLRWTVHLGKLFIALQSSLLFGGSGLGSSSYPGQFLPKQTLSGSFLSLFDIESLRLSFQIRGIGAFVASKAFSFQLYNHITNRIQKITVMTHQQNRPLKAL